MRGDGDANADIWTEGLALYEDLANQVRRRGAADHKAHARRKRYVAACQASWETHANLSVELAKSKLRRGIGVGNVALDSQDAVALLWALRPQQERERGAPAVLRDYHTWIAIHFNWLISGGAEPARARASVQQAWCVSRTTVVDDVAELERDPELSSYGKSMVARAADRDVQFLEELYMRMVRFLLAASVYEGMPE